MEDNKKGTKVRFIDNFKYYNCENSPELDLVKYICKIKGLKKQKFIENAVHHEIERYYDLFDEEQKKRFKEYVE